MPEDGTEKAAGKEAIGILVTLRGESTRLGMRPTPFASSSTI